MFEEWNDKIVQALLDDNRGGGGLSPTSSECSDEEIIKEELETLESWARVVDHDAKSDRVRYWCFKIPAILGAASTSVFEAFSYGWAVIAFGVLATVCAAIDAADSGGLLHNVHRRAANEIFLLRDRVRTNWDIIALQYGDTKSMSGREQESVKLMTMIKNEKDRIKEYLMVAEASLDNKPHSRNNDVRSERGGTY
jgi:hypothetical protein